MPRVQRSSLAKSDLKQIGRHIAKESQSRNIAFAFLDRIGTTCQTYATQPEAGELCPDLGENIRRFTVGNYVVFYSPLSDGITVLRILHGNRDIPSVWRNKEKS